MSSDPILEVIDLKTHFKTDDGIVRAVDGASFTVQRRELLGIVGESGCGKSVTALSVMNLVPKPLGKIVGGTINYYRPDGNKIEITAFKPREKRMRKIRGNEITMIFQDPMSALNPLFTIGNQITEVVRLHQRVTKEEAREIAVESLKHVEMPNPEKYIDRYPHELSGGMRQRAMIAMALSCNPSLLIADEPTTALDVTVESQILDLLKHLQKKDELSVMLITHDLDVVAQMANRIIVMYVGKIVEDAEVDELFSHPKHPYTQGLLASIPRIGLKQLLTPIQGVVPNLTKLPQGCHFAPRCVKAMDVCSKNEPDTIFVGKQHSVKCWLYADSARTE